MEDAGGNQVKDKLITPYHQGMAGVISSLKTDNHVSKLAEEVDDLPLAFVTPLTSHDYHVGHFLTLSSG
jgi:hypothetical protein